MLLQILFAPLTGLEVVGQPHVEGSSIVVELRLNTNLHDLTIEQVYDGTLFVLPSQPHLTFIPGCRQNEKDAYRPDPHD
jgi:hypothetical protein